MEKRARQRIERIVFRGLLLDDLHPENLFNAIRAKSRSRIAMLSFNVLAILLFTYSLTSGLSNLSEDWLIVLGVVFSINILYIGWQIIELRRLLHYYISRHSSSGSIKDLPKLPRV